MFHLYGLMLGLAIVVAFSAVEKIASTKERELLRHIAPWAGISALVGARAYHLVTDWQLYMNASIFDLLAVWRGGLGIYGAVMGAVAGSALYLWRNKQLNEKTIYVVLDLLAFGLPLGQAIGRWGNYFNHELFGRPTTLPWGVFIPEVLRPSAFASSTHFHPLFLYESVPMLVLWMFFRRKHSNIGTGRIFAIYLVIYGTTRFMLDFVRVEPVRWVSVPVSQLVSAVAVILGCVLLLTQARKSAKIL